MKQNRPISTLLLQINTYQILQTVSLFYVALPAILFISGWLKISISFPLILLILISIYHALKAAWHFNSSEGEFIKLRDLRQLKNVTKLCYLIILLLVIFMVICSGLGGFAVQDGDYVKHNAFYNDLVNYRWPLAYEQTGPDDVPRVLNTYVGYYLPSALVGKIVGWSSGYFFSFIWACLGLLLTILWIILFTKGWPLLVAMLFLFFSGLDYFGWEYFVKSNHFGIDYNYSGWMMFYAGVNGVEMLNGVFWILGSNHTAIANAPHHIFPSWVCILMLFHDSVKRESTNRILFISSFLPFVSAFLSVGTLPFVILAILQNNFKKCFTWLNLLTGPLLAATAGLYLISNNAQFTRGWIWDFMDISKAYPFLVIFYLTGFGLYFLVMPRELLSKKELHWLWVAVSCIIIFPIYRIGAAMDFPLKGFSPSWVIFQVCLAIILKRIFSDPYSSLVNKVRGSILIGLFCLASVAPLSNITTAIKSGLFESHISKAGILPINAYKNQESLQLFSDGQTFFWRSLAKDIEYDTTTNRETLIDKFGNTFRLEFIKCNEKQGYYVAVNGAQQGCCVKLTKTNDGFVEALDGFGDTWIYKENGWRSTIEIISDKFGNTFQLDTKNSCNEKQGYYILLNGKHNGCCKTLTLNGEGLVEAVDGFGERWLFKDQTWIKT